LDWLLLGGPRGLQKSPAVASRPPPAFLAEQRSTKPAHRDGAGEILSKHIIQAKRVGERGERALSETALLQLLKANL
jgi:hypothetical protein